MQLTIPDKVRRDACINVHATFTDKEREDPNNAWYEFNHVVSKVFYVGTVQDNTIGQVCLTNDIKERGSCTAMVNLYGLSSHKVNARIKAFHVENRG